jgi:glycine cleavage system H lipoate-binding protein
MKSPNTLERDLYYTASHEWIEFHNIEAFIGVTNYRITGVKEIKKIEFVRIYGFKKKGEVLANIQFDCRRIQVRMPVDGNIIGINDMNLLVSQNLLLNSPEAEGWLVRILVSQSCPRKGLISYEQYSSNI